MDEKKELHQIVENLKKDPYANLLGIELERIEEGYAKVKVKIKSDFCNFLGYIHGGLIFSLADQAFAVASNSREKEAVALQMNINYVRAPSVGDTLFAEAKEQHLGSNIGLYRIRIKNARQQLIAETQGMVYRKR